MNRTQEYFCPWFLFNVTVFLLVMKPQNNTDSVYITHLSKQNHEWEDWLFLYSYFWVMVQVHRRVLQVRLKRWFWPRAARRGQTEIPCTLLPPLTYSRKVGQEESSASVSPPLARSRAPPHCSGGARWEPTPTPRCWSTRPDSWASYPNKSNERFYIGNLMLRNTTSLTLPGHTFKLLEESVGSAKINTRLILIYLKICENILIGR